MVGKGEGGEKEGKKGDSSMTTRNCVKPLGACQQCRVRKTRCDGSFPCTRCSRLSLACRPQQIPDAAATRLWGELAVNKTDPRALAHVYIRAFRQVHAEGEIDRAKVLRMLATWATFSILCGSDVTLGIAREVQEMCQVSPLEVEGRRSLEMDFPPERRLWKAQKEAARLPEDMKRLKETAAFRLTDDGTTPQYLVEVQRRRLAQATNKGFDCFSGGALQMFDDLTRRKTLQALLFAARCAHQDREALFRLIVRAFFARDEKSGGQEFIKYLDPQGEMTLFIAKARTVDKDGVAVAAASEEEKSDADADDDADDEGRGVHTVLITFERAPPSRHVSDTPQFKKVAKLFRPVEHTRSSVRTDNAGGTHTAPAPAAAAATGCAGRSISADQEAFQVAFPPAVPAMATIPLFSNDDNKLPTFQQLETKAMAALSPSTTTSTSLNLTSGLPAIFQPQGGPRTMLSLLELRVPPAAYILPTSSSVPPPSTTAEGQKMPIEKQKDGGERRDGAAGCKKGARAYARKPARARAEAAAAAAAVTAPTAIRRVGRRGSKATSISASGDNNHKGSSSFSGKSAAEGEIGVQVVEEAPAAHMHPSFSTAAAYPLPPREQLPDLHHHQEEEKNEENEDDLLLMAFGQEMQIEEDDALFLEAFLEGIDDGERGDGIDGAGDATLGMHSFLMQCPD